MFRRNQSVSSKPLQLFVCLGSIFLIAVLWLAASSELRSGRDRTIEGAIRENQNRAAALEQYVMRTLETADFVAVHLAQFHLEDILPRESSTRPVTISDPLAANPLFAGVIIVDDRGEVRATTMPSVPRLNLASLPAFQRLRRNEAEDGPVLTNLALSQFAGRPVIALTRRIRNADGSFGGAVIVQIVAERLVDFNKGATTRPLDLISIIGLDGISLARRQGRTVSFGEDLRGKLVMRQQLKHPNGTYLGPSGLDGLPRYFSHRRLESYGIFVTAGLGEADVLAEIRRRSGLVYLGLAALTLAILAFAVSTVLGLRRKDRAALELAAANTRLREAQSIARMGDWDYDLATGTTHWSDELCRMYGRDIRNDRMGLEDAFEYFPGEERGALQRAADQAVRTGEPQKLDAKAVLPDGQISFRRVRIAARRGPEGDVVRLVGTDQDVTSEKEHERLRDEVAHMARVESMNAMAVTIAHELAQPLTAASNYVACLKTFMSRGAPGDDALARETLEHVRDQIGNTRDIIRRAREMVASRRGTEANAFLPDAVEDAVALVEMANDFPGLQVVRRLDPAASHVAADKVQIQQVLTNLIRNAAEAAEGVADRQILVSSALSDDRMVKVCVSDNGLGISRDLGDLFSPFTSSKQAGLGLGLSISRMIILSFGGSIWVDSASGEGGATICFSLPLASGPGI